MTGLPSSTLRYYESIGIVQPVGRDASSKHRTYGEEDLNTLTAVACLSATGMSLKNMREYLQYRDKGVSGAPKEIELLQAQEKKLAEEVELLKVRQKYVNLKIAYWQAVAAGNEAERTRVGDQARELTKDLQPLRKQEDI